MAVLKFNLCDFNDAYILVKGDMTIANDYRTLVTFKNWALFIKCITKIDGRTLDDDEDLHLVMLMYNLI